MIFKGGGAPSSPGCLGKSYEGKPAPGSEVWVSASAVALDLLSVP